MQNIYEKFPTKIKHRILNIIKEFKLKVKFVSSVKAKLKT